MPNWVYNTLTAEGSTEAIAAFRSDMARPIPTFRRVEGSPFETVQGEWDTEETEFSFLNILAPSAEELAAYFTTANNEAPGGNWYAWNNRNWGTKWDASDTEIVLDSAAEVIIRFSTAWAPPEPVFAALCEKYPELNLTLGYEEEQGWGGEYQSDTEGGYYESSSYDIPTSHAEHEERERECVCSWIDEPDDWYSDCPREDEDESRLVAVGDLTEVLPK